MDKLHSKGSRRSSKRR